MLKFGEPPIGVPYVHMDIICLYGRVATPYFIVNTPHGTPAKMCASKARQPSRRGALRGTSAWHPKRSVNPVHAKSGVVDRDTQHFIDSNQSKHPLTATKTVLLLSLLKKEEHAEHICKTEQFYHRTPGTVANPYQLCSLDN